MIMENSIFLKMKKGFCLNEVVFKNIIYLQLVYCRIFYFFIFDLMSDRLSHIDALCINLSCSPWNFGKKNWILVKLKMSVFFSKPFEIFSIFFASSPWKLTRLSYLKYIRYRLFLHYLVIFLQNNLKKRSPKTFIPTVYSWKPCKILSDVLI